MTQLRLSTLALAAVFALPACDPPTEGKSDEGKSAKADPPKPAAKDPSELFTAKVPEPPGPLTKVKFGMTAEEAKKAAPELEDGYSKIDEWKDTYFGYYVPDKEGKLRSMRVVVEAEGVELEKVLTAKWGEPKVGEDLGKPKLFWFNPEKAIRATISKGFGKEKEVQFEPYLPATKLLGEDKAKMGFEAHPLLGASYDDLKEHYAEHLEVLTKEEAEKQRKRIEKMTGKDLGVLGDAVASTNIDLPPTEYGSVFTRVHPTMEEGKVVRFRFGISFEGYPAAKDEILGLIKAKYGDPKEEEKYGKKLLVFGDAPRIAVEEDTISKKWDIEVGGKK